MLFYLFQVTLLWAVFSLMYHLLLSGKSMFRFNRWYLLGTLFGSLVIPLIPFSQIFGTNVPLQTFSLVQTINLNELVIEVDKGNTVSSFDWIFWIKALFWAGVMIFTFRFLNNLRKLSVLFRRSEKNVYDGLTICKIPYENQVFSFGNVIFIDKNLLKTLSENSAVWLHEKTHIQQKHSLDVLMVELTKIFFWFHPLVYLYEHHIRMNHEYSADEAVLKQTQDVKAYQHELLDYMENGSNALASTFNFKLTQKRFIMMKIQTTQKSKVLAILAVAFGMMTTVTFVSCSKEKEQTTEESKDINNDEIMLDESDVSTESIDTSEEPMKFVQQKALPKEGMNNFYKNFLKEFKGDVSSENTGSSKDTIAKVRLTFVVEKDGSLSNIKEVTGKNAQLAEEAIRVLKTMPNWEPAQHEGKTVRSSFTMPIVIRLN